MPTDRWMWDRLGSTIRKLGVELLGAATDRANMDILSTAGQNQHASIASSPARGKVRVFI